MRLPVDVRSIRVEHEPVGAPIHPNGEPERLDELDGRRDEIATDDALLDDLEVGLDDEPAVEGRNRRREREGLDEHRHAARRPPARHGEVDSGVVERVHGGDRARRQLLLFVDEGSVDVGEHEPDHFSDR